MAEEIVSEVEWREIPGWPEYRVNRSGEVLTSNKRGWSPQTGWRRLKPFFSKTGYVCYDFWRDGRRSKMKAHRIVLMTFVGPSNGLDACHNNGNKLDNRLENLRWDTRKENIRDSVRHGTHSRFNAGKLKRDQVLEIKRLLASGESQMQIGRKFGVSGVCIWKIANGKSWSRINSV